MKRIIDYTEFSQYSSSIDEKLYNDDGILIYQKAGFQDQYSFEEVETFYKENGVIDHKIYDYGTMKYKSEFQYSINQILEIKNLIYYDNFKFPLAFEQQYKEYSDARLDYQVEFMNLQENLLNYKHSPDIQKKLQKEFDEKYSTYFGETNEMSSITKSILDEDGNVIEELHYDISNSINNHRKILTYVDGDLDEEFKYNNLGENVYSFQNFYIDDNCKGSLEINIKNNTALLIKEINFSKNSKTSSYKLYLRLIENKGYSIHKIFIQHKEANKSTDFYIDLNNLKKEAFGKLLLLKTTFLDDFLKSPNLDYLITLLKSIFDISISHEGNVYDEICMIVTESVSNQPSTFIKEQLFYFNDLRNQYNITRDSIKDVVLGGFTLLDKGEFYYVEQLLKTDSFNEKHIVYDKLKIKSDYIVERIGKYEIITE